MATKKIDPKLLKIAKELQIEPLELEKLSYWFAQFCSWDEKIEIFFQARKEFFERQHNFSKSEKGMAMLTSFLNQVHKVRANHQSQSKSQKLTYSKERLDQTTLNLIKNQKKKKATQRDFILSHYTEIDRVYQTGTSWADIAIYLKRRYKRSISDSYLRRTFYELMPKQTPATKKGQA